jgi:hypothetical protein
MAATFCGGDDVATNWCPQVLGTASQGPPKIIVTDIFLSTSTVFHPMVLHASMYFNLSSTQALLHRMHRGGIEPSSQCLVKKCSRKMVLKFSGTFVLFSFFISMFL